MAGGRSAAGPAPRPGLRALAAGGIVGMAGSALWFVATPGGSRCEGLSCLGDLFLIYLAVPAATAVVGGLIAWLLRLRRPVLFALTAPVLGFTAGTGMTLLLIAAPNLVIPILAAHHLAVAVAGLAGVVVAALLVSGGPSRRGRAVGAVVAGLLTVIAIVLPVKPGPDGHREHAQRFLTAPGLPLLKVDSASVLVGVGRDSPQVPLVLRYAGADGGELAGRTYSVEIRRDAASTGCASSTVPVPPDADCEDTRSGRWIYRYPTLGAVVVVPRPGAVAVFRGDPALPAEPLFLEAYQLRDTDVRELIADIVAL